MAPKPAGKAAKGPAPPNEPDPAAQLPPDLPAECPFQSNTWHAVICTVQVADGVNGALIKDAFKQLKVLQQLSLAELAARTEPADPLAAEIAASEAVHATTGPGNSVPASTPLHLAAKLLQQRFTRDQGLAWKFELVRRREALAKAETDAKVAHDNVVAAHFAGTEAASKLEIVKARLPQPEPVLGKSQTDCQEFTAEEDSNAAAGNITQPDGLQLLAVHVSPPELSPQQKHMLADAEAAVAAARARLSVAESAATTADAALATTQQALNKPHNHYEPYWVDGLPSTAAGLSAAITAADIPLRAVIWLYPHSSSSSSSAAAMPTAVSPAKAGADSAAAPSKVELPEELSKLQAAVVAAPWDSPLASLLVLPVPVGDTASPFTTVPPGSSIANPPWAAASSAAAAMKLAMTTAAAAEAKPPHSAGAKPGSAVSAAKAGLSSTGAAASAAAGKAGTPGAATGGIAAAGVGNAAAVPEDVPGCKELARALLTVRDQVKVYDQWRAMVRVYRMPEPDKCSSMQYYQHLLQHVPPERQNVLMVLHAMLEQVCRNCSGDAEALGEQEQELHYQQAVASAEEAVAAAFAGLIGEESKLLKEPSVDAGGLTVLYQGDELAAAACGLTSGYINSPATGQQGVISCCSPTSTLDSSAFARPLSGSSSRGSDSATNSSRSSSDDGGSVPGLFDVTRLCATDVDATEHHMLQMLPLPALTEDQGGRQHLQDQRDADLQRQLHAAELQAQCTGLPLCTVQRYQLLKAAVAMLPEGTQAAHAGEILSRRHQEQLEPRVLRQVLMKALQDYPDIATAHFEPLDVAIVALYADAQTDRLSTRSMPCIHTFQQYWQQLLDCGCVQPELAPKVYEMSADAAKQSWQRQLLYTDAGGILSRGNEGMLALHEGSNTIRLQPVLTGSYEMVATLDGGLVVSVSCTGATKAAANTVSNAAEPAAAAQQAAAEALGPTEAAVPEPEPAAGPAEKPNGKDASVSKRSGTSDTSAAAATAAKAQDQAAAAIAAADTPAALPAQSAAGTISHMAPASASAAALRVCTPQGMVVELNTDGRVLLAPIQPPQLKALADNGVNVLGAPLAAGQLEAQLPAGPFAWHALLPDGTLIKADTKSAEAADQPAVLADSAAVGDLLMAGAAAGGLSILHPDGSTSQTQQGTVEVADWASSAPVPAAGWVHSSITGESTWTIDQRVIEAFKAASAKAEAGAIAAAEAAAAAAAAEAAAAAQAATKKGGKGDKGRTLDKLGSGAKGGSTGYHTPLTSTAGDTGSAAAAAGSATTAGSSTYATLQCVLKQLQQLEPVSKGSIRTACMTDPDTKAVVCTREDHVMVVGYTDGSRLVQDAEGCRISSVSGTWRFEAPAMPQVCGSDDGVTLSPCPGITLSWSAHTGCVTLHHALSGAVFIATSCGRAAFSGQPIDQDFFIDLAMPQQALQQQQAPTAAVPEASFAGMAAVTGDALASEQDGPNVSLLSLLDACSQEQTLGIFGVDLCTGEAVVQEQNGSRLHQASGGKMLVWSNSHDVAAAEAQQHELSIAGLSTAGQQETESRVVGSPLVLATPPLSIPRSAGQEPQQAVTAAAASNTLMGFFDDELDDDRAARLAAEAAAAAAVAAAAEAAAAAAAATEAARPPPIPVALGVKPRLFVVDRQGGAGYEVLSSSAVSDYLSRMNIAAAMGPSSCKIRHVQQAVVGAAEAGTTCHCIMRSYSLARPELQQLPLADPTVAKPVQLDPSSSLMSLRRTDVFMPAELPLVQGFKLPRVAALNPGYVCGGEQAVDVPASGTAQHSIGKGGSLLSTRLPHTAAGPARGGCSSSGESSRLASQVVVVREVLELPELTPEVRSEAQRILDAWAEWKDAQKALLIGRLPPEDPRSEQLQAQAAEVAALLAVAQQDRSAAQATAVQPWAGRVGHNDNSTGGCRLEAIRGQLVADQAFVAAAAARAAEEAAATAAAEAAAKRKPYKPWEKKVGPYDHTPQRPEAGKTLKYFETQEGLVAAAIDPLLQGAHLTRHNLPPAKPVQPASPGTQHKPGVYLASSTALEGDSQGYASGLAAMSPSAACAQSSPIGSSGRSPGTSVRKAAAGAAVGKLGSPSGTGVTPLMYSGKPFTLQRSAANANASINFQQQLQDLQRQQEEAADAAVRAIMLGGSYSSGAGAAVADSAVQGDAVLATSQAFGSGGIAALKTHAYDVYGQPRVMQPSLPASHLKNQAPAGLNVGYLAKELPTMRTEKTSSANLIKCSGKATKQLALSPGHIHFGNVTVGSVSHRTARLLNCSTGVARFNIVRPELPLRVLYKPGPLPAGMEATFTVELVAEQPGDFVGEITVKSEVNVLVLTVSAKVQAAVRAEPEKAAISTEDDQDGSVVSEAAAHALH